MKKEWGLLALIVVLSACNDHASINIHVDSIGKKKAELIWDSSKSGLKKAGQNLGEKARDLGDKTKQKLDEITGKDSSRKN